MSNVFSHPSPASDATANRFKLVRWFVVASMVTIGLTSVVAAEALSRFMTREMLERDMAVSTEFVNSVVQVQRATSYFYGDTFDPKHPEMEEFFRHVANLPDVIRANVFSRDRTILWSSDSALIGQKFSDNAELEAAFLREAHPEIETREHGEKAEHAGLPAEADVFVENYLPIWSADGRIIVGVVEMYKTPAKLLASISRAKDLIWLGASLAGLLVFVGLTVVVRYAGKMLAQQETRILEAERLAVVGEMTSAVAHGIRNPLAAIRSSAELALEDELQSETRESLIDIVLQSDRLESWIRGFLTRAHEEGNTRGDICRAEDVLRNSFQTFAPQMAQRDIEWNVSSDGDAPLVLASPEDLTQVLNCLISNGIEAIERDGTIRADVTRNGDGMFRIDLVDSGPGFTEEAEAHLFQPLVSGKSSGLGVGLNLARRTIERLGGQLEIGNAPGGGARARINLPCHGGTS